MKTSESIANIAAAFVKFQNECPAPKKSAVNPHFKASYSPLDEILSTIKPHMATHGLSQLQSTMTEGENIGVKTILLHSSGEFIEFDTLWLPMGKTTAQGAGSSVTYARRYALCAALGIAAEDDDDGNNASEAPKQNYPSNPKPNTNSSNNTSGISGVVASEKQIKAIHAIIRDVAKARNVTDDMVKDQLKQRLGIETLEGISKQLASQAIELLNQWKEPKHA